MADSFFGFDTSLSNLNDDEGGGGPSEDEYDALNDETFGQDSEEFDWEVEHENLAQQIESNRRNNCGIDETANTQLEASLSQLVLDETDSPHSRAFGSSVWRHDISTSFTAPRTPVPTLKNVCTVEELERQLRQKQMSQPTPMSQSQMSFTNQNYFQPRFPPVILQRPPGLQAPVPLPFAPQQTMTHNINPLNQPLNKIVGPNSQINQINQTNLLQNHLSSNVNQMSQNINQLNPTQLGQNVNQLNPSQLGQNVNQLSQNVNQLSQSQLAQNVNQLNQNQLGQNVNQFMQNANQMISQYQNNPIGQSSLMNQMSQNMQNTHQMNQSSQLLQNQNQLLQNQTSQLLQNQQSPLLHNQTSHLLQNQSSQVLQGQPSQMMQGQPNQLMQNQLNQTQIGQNVNQLTQNQLQNVNLAQNMNQMSQNVNQIGQNMSQMGQNVNQMGQNIGQLGQNVNQMMPNGNQFGMNQFPRMMGQPRMIAPPPGINMPRQNFSPNMGQFNPTFRGPTIQSTTIKPTEQQPMNQNMAMNQSFQQLKPLNQSPQITKSPNQTQKAQPMNQNQQKTQKPDAKVQKSRVYNNSNSQPQNLTSENLVQMIQNTHPMLLNNYGYHNAMLRINLLSNNSMFKHLLNNQRHNGTYNNSRHMNGDDSSANSDDEYAGLMTQREKQWLINIQMLQLHTGTPYIHDFYYTVFLERQASKEKECVKEAHKANQQNHPFYSGGVKQETHTRERHNSVRHNSTGEDGTAPRTYVPTQFENSLGKLQCGSVTAPRKIIDVEVVGGESSPRTGRNSRAPSRASTTNPAEVPRELKRTKQLLLDIESLYIILLRLEELNDPLAISNALVLKDREEKQKQLQLQIDTALKKALDNEQEEDSNLFLRNIESVQRRPKQDSPKSESIDKRQVVNLAVNQKPAPVKNLLDEDKDDLINKMFSGLLHSDRLQQMLTVRKGRTLVARFLTRVSPSHGQLRGVWSRVLRALPAAARRDDGTLASLAPHYIKYIQNTTGWSAILESCGLLSEALDPARTPYALTTAFTLSCVCALLEKASLLVNTPEATANERQWSKFLKTLARALKNTSLTVAKSIHPISETKLMFHMRQLESRSTIEILQRGKTAAEFADLSKADVSEQLVKHLC